MSKVIGIDLGTTNSVVAVMEGGEPVNPKRRRKSNDALRSSFREEWTSCRRIAKGRRLLIQITQFRL